jgi:hypothetical protein
MSDSMTVAEVLTDAFQRIQQRLSSIATGLTAEQLAFRPRPGANSIGWLLWHLTRIQDDHIADVAGSEQVWTAEGWYDRFGLPIEPADTGYGHSAEQVTTIRIEDPQLLIGYSDAVCRRTIGYVSGLREADLGRIVDKNWDPPVSLGARLVSVLGDDLQHLGQAGYVRGLLEN